jgi:hypothetical protein
MPAASVEASKAQQNDEGEGESDFAGIGDRARSDAPIPWGECAVPASAGPCGPGRRERSDRSRRPSEASGHADPRRGRAVKRGLLTARLRAGTAACRAQRRAGALHGGRHDVKPPQRLNAGDGADIPGAPPSAPTPGRGRPSARPSRSSPDRNGACGVKGGSRRRVSSAGATCAACFVADLENGQRR